MAMRPTSKEDTECDLCSGVKDKRVQSCLVCHVGVCEDHVEAHDRISAVQAHTLIQAPRPQEKACLEHKRVLERFCFSDGMCVCLLCSIDHHQGHNVVAAEVARPAKQEQLLRKRRACQKRLLETESVVLELTQAMASYKLSAEQASETCDQIFSEPSGSAVKQLILGQQEAAVGRAEGILRRLEQEMADLGTVDAKLTLLTQEDDHIHFLQSFQAYHASPIPDHPASVALSSCRSFSPLMDSLAASSTDLSLLERINTEVQKIHIVLPLEPKTREELMEYSYRLTFDPNTVHRSLSLSDGNTVVLRPPGVEHTYPEHALRFDGWAQVLCLEPVSACHYWEVEWAHVKDDGNGVGVGLGVDIAVAYKTMERKGSLLECRFGCHGDHSWRLECDPGRCWFQHNDLRTELSSTPGPRVGVYVDHRAGILSFYSVAHTATLIHTVQTVFREPLYPGFWLAQGASVRLC